MRRSTTTPRPMAALAAAIVALALVLAACSSSSSDGASTTSPKTTTTSAGATSGSSSSGAGSGSGKALARYAGYESKSYDDPSHWVCRPDQDDICDESLDATRIDADGTTTVEPFEKAKDPGFDCFYVYPTISRDAGLNSDWKASDDEEGWVTLNQAARLQSECRLFAPVYRQITLAGLAGAISGDGTQFSREELDKFRAMPYDDVLDAWKTYMAEDNGGRPVLLIGHSQGSGMLNELIANEIDPHADVRKVLVGAYLAGGSVAVPEGKDVGGDFQHVPLCTKDGQPGCVATWATFRSTAPPPANSFFGKPRGAGAGEVAGCVSPAVRRRLGGPRRLLPHHAGRHHDEPGRRHQGQADRLARRVGRQRHDPVRAPDRPRARRVQGGRRVQLPGGHRAARRRAPSGRHPRRPHPRVGPAPGGRQPDDGRHRPPGQGPGCRHGHRQLTGPAPCATRSSR
ncbi:MAG: DUF3089 domain-containing protein [Acidimicrobiales bacterium]